MVGCKFLEKILQDELPYSFKPLNYEYDGSTGPYEHLVRFENSALLHRYGEGVKYMVFLTTLSKAAHQWFSQLEPRLIGSFAEFSTIFLHQFASARR